MLGICRGMAMRALLAVVLLLLLLLLLGLVRKGREDYYLLASEEAGPRRLGERGGGGTTSARHGGVIPLNIYTAWETASDLPTHMREAVNEMIATNPEFQHSIYDDGMCREFIRKHFNSEVLRAYDSLEPDAFKSDLWRYAVLYISGGVYVDIKYRPANGFKLISLIDREHFVRDYKTNEWYNGVYNGFMVVRPQSRIMKQMIDAIVSNVKNAYYGNNSLDVTGPSLLYKQFSAEEVGSMKLSLGVKAMAKRANYPTKYLIMQQLTTPSSSNISLPILESYPEYRQEQREQGSGKMHYGRLWKRKRVYKKSFLFF